MSSRYYLFRVLILLFLSLLYKHLYDKINKTSLPLPFRLHLLEEEFAGSARAFTVFKSFFYYFLVQIRSQFPYAVELFK